MKIVMEKRKGGIYAQWYTIEGRNPKGNRVSYLIYPQQAKTYAQAVQFFNKTWGKDGHIGLVLRNSEPYSNDYCLAA